MNPPALDALFRNYLTTSHAGEAETLFRNLVQLLLAAVRAEEGSLLLYDPEKKDLVFALTEGSRESESTLRGQRLPLGQGVTGMAALTGDVQIGAPRFRDLHQRVRADADGTPAGVVAAPMFADQALQGVLTAVRFDAGRPFTPEDAALCARVAVLGGFAVWQMQQLERLTAPDAAPPLQSRSQAARIDKSLRRIGGWPDERLEAVANLLDAAVRLGE